MGFRRGFKTEADGIAREIRQELGLNLTDRVDPLKLAEHLDIPVIPLSALRQEVPAIVRHFSRSDQSAFSAVTVFDGLRRVIVHNDSHSAGRRASNVAHEISHGLLLHPARPPLDGHGNRDWDREQELEADWLAGVILVPDEAALLIVRRGLNDAEGAELYGVSQPMMRFRLNMSGARIRVKRAARYRMR